MFLSEVTALPRRNANYALLKSLKPFKPGSPKLMIGTCGNIQSLISGEPYLEGYKSNPDYSPLYERVSAPMLLARLCAGFKGLKVNVGGQEFYKTTWEVVLVHKATGNVVTFYDWKGASSIGSNVYGEDALEIISDVKALVEALCDNQFPHPYDDCTVGEIA